MVAKSPQALEPYLISEPNEVGEVQMICPLHPDTKRSASLNVNTGAWYCFAGCGGGSLKELLGRRSEWIPPSSSGASPRPSTQRTSSVQALPSEAQIRGWTEQLMENTTVLRKFRRARGLSNETIRELELGYSEAETCYTIPVRSSEGELETVRFYNLRPAEEQRKFWHVTGHAGPFIYPAVLNQNGGVIIVCEGELDALISIQAGFPALTRTGGAGTWKAQWSSLFKDLVVYVCHDMDETGQKANAKVGRALAKVAKEVRVINLPYPVNEKHGKDLTDFWRERGGTNNADAQAEFRSLMESADLISEVPLDVKTLDPETASPADAANAELLGKPLRLTLTIKGRGRAGFAVPRHAELRCDAEAGAMCTVCPMQKSMYSEVEVAKTDPLILKMIGSSDDDVEKAIKRKVGVPAKCPRVQITSSRQSVQHLFARQSVGHANGVNGTTLNSVDAVLKITSVGRHDTPSNCTVQITGAVQNNPRTQETEFQAWEVNEIDSLGQFASTPETHKLLSVFQAGEKDPLDKLKEIADALSTITHIYGRTMEHIAMDLVWHSPLQFNFQGQQLDRGWLELLVVGDTRTGKSLIAEALMRYYKAGELVDCEEASMAGIIGGVQQIRNEWMVTWGVLPVNDRRLVVLDEVSGIDVEEIGQLSGVRASGIASIDKVVSEKTYARTRKIWIGNPREDLTMSEYAFGIYAIRPLIGRSEDIARFDLALTMRSNDVDVEKYLIAGAVQPTKVYTREACSTLIRWAWTRDADDVVWEDGAEQEVLKVASKLGRTYIATPPLILRQDVRIKVARVAAAIAARLYSTRDGEEVYVRIEHVRAASRFIDELYSDERFGYRYLSTRSRRESAHATKSSDKAWTLIDGHESLAVFLLSRPEGRFFGRDLEEVLSMNREGANGVINGLMRLSMVTKDRGWVKITPELSTLLREKLA